MTRILALLIAAVALIGLVSGASTAAPSYLNTTGLILTPDDSVLGPGDLAASYHQFGFDNFDVDVLGATIGVTQSLEIGLASLDSDLPGADNETVISAKYSVLTETAATPSLVLGVADISGDLDPEDDPSFYAVAGKSLPGLLGGDTPLRGYLGLGTGIYDGFFLGAEWTISSRARLMFEYIDEITINNTIAEDSVFNVGLRFALADRLRGDVSLIDGDDFAFGISYNRAAF